MLGIIGKSNYSSIHQYLILCHVCLFGPFAVRIIEGNVIFLLLGGWGYIHITELFESNDGSLTEVSSVIPKSPIHFGSFWFLTFHSIYSSHTYPSEALIINEAAIEKQINHVNRLSSGISYDEYNHNYTQINIYSLKSCLCHFLCSVLCIIGYCSAIKGCNLVVNIISPPKKKYHMDQRRHDI